MTVKCLCLRSQILADHRGAAAAAVMEAAQPPLGPRQLYEQFPGFDRLTECWQPAREAAGSHVRSIEQLRYLLQSEVYDYSLLLQHVSRPQVLVVLQDLLLLSELVPQWDDGDDELMMGNPAAAVETAGVVGFGPLRVLVPAAAAAPQPPAPGAGTSAALWVGGAAAGVGVGLALHQQQQQQQGSGLLVGSVGRGGQVDEEEEDFDFDGEGWRTGSEQAAAEAAAAAAAANQAAARLAAAAAAGGGGGGGMPGSVPPVARPTAAGAAEAAGGDQAVFGEGQPALSILQQIKSSRRRTRM